jgi:hypothetical protein
MGSTISIFPAMFRLAIVNDDSNEVAARGDSLSAPSVTICPVMQRSGSAAVDAGQIETNSVNARATNRVRREKDT